MLVELRCARFHFSDKMVRHLPVVGHVTIGPWMSALMTYFNVAHAFPYDRLSQVCSDLLGFSISVLHRLAPNLWKVFLHSPLFPEKKEATSAKKGGILKHREATSAKKR